MVFSREEQQIWRNSEVMRELERLASENKDILETPPEAYLPIKTAEDESAWEDEEKLRDALEDFEGEEKSIEKQREKEIPFDEEKVMPRPEHETELSGYIEPEDVDPEDWDEEEKWETFNEGEVRPWNWKGTLNPTEIEANLISNLTKLSSYLGAQGKVVEADKINKAILNIKIAVKEARNGD